MGDSTFIGKYSTGSALETSCDHDICYFPYLSIENGRMGYSDGGINSRHKFDKIWYDIVDGNFLFWAIVEQMEEVPRCRGLAGYCYCE